MQSRKRMIPLVLTAFVAFGSVAFADDSDSDSDSHKAHPLTQSDEGLFGFKFSLDTVDGSTIHTVEDEHGAKHAKLVIGKEYRVTGKVPRRIQQEITHLILEHRGEGEEDWTAMQKIRLLKSGRFDDTFKIPLRAASSRQKFRVRSFDDDGREEVVSSPALTSGVLLAEADWVVTFVVINDTKSDLVVHYPHQQLSNGDYCESETNLNQQETITFTFTNPPSWAAMAWYLTRQKPGAIEEEFALRWDHKVKGYDDCGCRFDSDCDASAPSLESGGTYYMRITPRALAGGFDGFFWGGDVAVCSTGFQTDWGSLISDHTGAFIYLSTEFLTGLTGMLVGCPLFETVIGAVVCVSGFLVMADAEVGHDFVHSLDPDFPDACPTTTTAVSPPSLQ